MLLFEGFLLNGKHKRCGHITASYKNCHSDISEIGFPSFTHGTFSEHLVPESENSKKIFTRTYFVKKTL